MFTFDLLTPWIVLAVALVLLLYVQRWIHRHLFGVGYLISREKHAATFFYYLLLLPGVILHEVSHYFVAGMFHVAPVHFMLFPEAQEDGSLEMGFIRLAAVKNPIYAAFIGAAPLLSGIAVIVLISHSMLDLPTFFARVGSWNIYEIGAAVQALVNKPDFLLWTYILFAVANAMMPNAEDRMGWWIIGAVGGGIILFLIVIGLHQIVVAWLSGPIAQALYSLSAVFGTVLFVDCLVAVTIWVIEAVLGRVTGHRVQYAPAQTAMVAAPRRPTLTSVYQLNLPLPPMPGRIMPATSTRIAPASPAIAASTSPEPARPAIPAPQTAGARPAITSGESPRPGEDKPKSPTLPTPTPSPARAAAPGSPAGQPSKPFGSPFSKPAESTGAPASPTSQPPKPGGPFGKPAASPTGTQGSQPPKPAGAAHTPAPPTGTQSGQGSQPPKPFGSPFGKPAAPAASKENKPGETVSKPPISGPPALARPGGSPPVPAKPNAPAAPFGRSPVGGQPRPAAGPAKFGGSKDDYIDADFVDDEDEEAEEPGFTKGIDKSKQRDSQDDDGEPKYVDLDDSP